MPARRGPAAVGKAGIAEATRRDVSVLAGVSRVTVTRVPIRPQQVSDLAGIGALMECRRRGIDVPGALPLVGFGDFEVGQQVLPALRTVSVDLSHLGDRAG